MKYVSYRRSRIYRIKSCRKINKEGNEVHVIDNFSFGKKENCNKKLIIKHRFISEIKFDQVKKIFENADTIFHLACIARVQPSIKNPVEYEMNKQYFRSKYSQSCC